MKLWRRVCVSTPFRASIRMTARSAVDAPVTMLRVYCSWPGVSATMNCAFVGREEPVGDVNRDALLALGGQAVDQQREIEVAAARADLLRVGGQRRELILEDHLRLVEQPADQRRLAVVHAAAGDEAQQGACAPARAGRPRRRSSRRSRAPSSEVAVDLLLFHRRRLIVIDHAALPLGDPGQQHLLDDGRQGRRVAVDRAGQRIAAERAKPHLAHLGRLAGLERHPVVVDHDPGAVAPHDRSRLARSTAARSECSRGGCIARRRARSSSTAETRAGSRLCACGCCRGARAPAAAASDPSGGVPSGSRTRAPWRATSLRRAGRRRTPRRSRSCRAPV